MPFTINSIQPVSILIGMGIILILWVVVSIFKKQRKNTTEKKSLPTLKSYIKEAHNHLVESANNLIKLNEVFNEIEEKQ